MILQDAVVISLDADIRGWSWTGKVEKVKVVEDGSLRSCELVVQWWST